MQRIGLILSAIIIIQGNLYSEITGDYILKKIDEIRKVGDSFAFEMEISSFSDESTLVDKYTIQGYVKIDKDQNVKTLVYFTDPKIIRGRKMFMEGNNVWILFPRTRNIIRLSPLQVLLGEVSNCDIAKISFSVDYNAEIIGEEVIDGKELYKLLLKVKEGREGCTYSEIILMVEKKTFIPVAAEFYTGAGKLIKKVWYDKVKEIYGKLRPMRITLYDGINPEKFTIMEYKKIKKLSIPDFYFNKEYLPRFTPPSLD